MKSKVFVNVIANAVIVFVVILIGVVVFDGSVTSVFGKTEQQPIYRGKGKNQVSLIFGVCDNGEYLLELLSILQDNDVKCTFFVSGSWVAQNGDLSQKITNGGNEIGNWGYMANPSSRNDVEYWVKEITACNKMVQKYCNAVPKLFMPKGGEYFTAIMQAVNNAGMQGIMFSRDTLDLTEQSVEKIIERASKNIADGEFVLLHTTKQSVSALPQILQIYRQLGINVVTVSQNIA